MKKNHWANFGESTFVTGIWFLYGIYGILGRIPFRLFLYPVVSYYWLFRPVARRSSLEYLKHLHASKNVFTKQPGWLQGYLHFIQFGETILDKLLAYGNNYPPEKVSFAGHKSIWEGLANQKGCVIVTAHIGCVELMQVASTWRKGFKINVLVHTSHATNFNRILNRINPNSGLNFIQVKTFDAPTAMMLADLIAAGEVIAIAGDRIPTSSNRIVKAEFLGKQAAFPTGPYLIASLLACPIYIMGCIRNGHGYSLKAEKIAEAAVTPRNIRHALIEDHAKIFAQRLEQWVTESPYDWFNFYPFWDQVTSDGK